MKRTGSGFTIVELLIVIVVIAILAAITIVSYSNITAQSKSAEMLARVDAYTKALKLYQGENGAYPQVLPAESGLTNSACLGSTSDFPADANFASGQCYKQTPSTTLSPSPTLNGQLKKFISTLPSGSAPLAISSDNSMYVKGILYTYIDASTAFIQFFQAGSNQKCGRGTASNTSQWPGVTTCLVII